RKGIHKNAFSLSIARGEESKKEVPTKFEIISDFHEPIIEQYKEFLKENEITVAGIEFIRSADRTIYPALTGSKTPT
nr:hypothetical protein [Streptococcus oralis]